MKVYAISDVHIDFEDNWNWIVKLSKKDFKNDALIVAGDVTHELSLLDKFFKELVIRFKVVSFVPGNHDLWVASSDRCTDSVEKFNQVIELCKTCGVHTEPVLLTGEPSDGSEQKHVWIVPMFSWYHEDFDKDEFTKHEKIEYWSDFSMCKWPSYALNPEDPTPSSPCGTPELYFLSLNNDRVNQSYKDQINFRDDNTTIITFSHFLPRRECLPEKEVLWIKYLPKVVGTERLESQIRKLGSNVHVFGHTHIVTNELFDDLHYIQLCLKYPREREKHPQYSLSSINEMVVWDVDQSQQSIYQGLRNQAFARKALKKAQ